ncbi:hypothetical protein HELRODRAFT_165994 [Helobdella robusta]|uniref:Uncharacterized protein n=1 Tax=Helobdella robusta TaxID=6412 RepID=T1EXJ7_HELRO|nr:hypothetical protein HELRODRAFT_165994 [Helobdella robusta]ESN90335.1 hypothetical protein HELRODRAFT_165994 [Helobdella robusta]
MEENKKRKGDNCGSNMIYWKKWCDRVATTIEIPSTSTVATDHISPSKSVIEAESVSDSKDEPHLIAAKLDIEVNTGAFCRICVIMGRSFERKGSGKLHLKFLKHTHKPLIIREILN